MDISALKNWNVLNCEKFRSTFGCCYWLVDISNDFYGIFYQCYYLENLKPIRNWNVPNRLSFDGMFGQLTKLTDLTPLKD